MVRLGLGFLEIEEAVQTCCLFFELLDPRIEHREGQFILATFMLVTIIDNNSVEIAPLGYFRCKPILPPYLLLSFLNPCLDCRDQTEQLPLLSLVRVHKSYDFGDMVFVFLLRADFFDAFFGFKLLTIILRFWVFFGLFFLLHSLFLCSRQAVGEKTEQVDQSTWVLEKCIGWQFTLGDLTGSPAYYLFELSWVFERNGEELADEQEMEQLFLDFGVHKDLVGHVGDECGQVDTLSEPALTHYSVYLCQRHHVFALEAFPGAHASLVILPQPQLIEMFDERDKNILGVVLLKGQVGVGGIKGGDARWVKVLIRNGGFRRDGF